MIRVGHGGFEARVVVEISRKGKCEASPTRTEKSRTRGDLREGCSRQMEKSVQTLKAGRSLVYSPCIPEASGICQTQHF